MKKLLALLFTASLAFGQGGNPQPNIRITGSSTVQSGTFTVSGSSTFVVNSPTIDGTSTFPASRVTGSFQPAQITGTAATLSGTETLTNKSITSNQLSESGSSGRMVLTSTNKSNLREIIGDSGIEASGTFNGAWSGGKLYRIAYGTVGTDDAGKTFLMDSTDGVNWTLLNSGSAVLNRMPATASCGTGLTRWNGEWVMTVMEGDLSTTYSGTTFGIAKSTDLLNWTYERSVPVSTAGISRVWSPKPFVDDDGSFYVLMTLTGTAGDPQNIYYMKAQTPDLSVWSAPTQFSYVQGGTATRIRDSMVVKDNGRYYMVLVSPPGTSSGGLAIATSDTFTGKWNRFAQFAADGEAAFMLRKPNGGWRFYIDATETGAGDRYFDTGPNMVRDLKSYAASGTLSPSGYHQSAVIFVGKNTSSDFVTPPREPVFWEPRPDSVQMFDDFIGGSTSAGLGSWNWLTNGTISVTGTAADITTGRVGVLKIHNSSAANGMIVTGAAGLDGFIVRGHFEMQFGFRFRTYSNVSYAIGMGLGSGLPQDGIYLRGTAGTDTNYTLVVKSGATTVTADSGVAVDATWRTARIRSISTDAGWSAGVSISNADRTTWSDWVWTTTPISYGALQGRAMQVMVNNTEAVEKGIDIDWMSYSTVINR